MTAAQLALVILTVPYLAGLTLVAWEMAGATIESVQRYRLGFGSLVLLTAYGGLLAVCWPLWVAYNLVRPERR